MWKWFKKQFNDKTPPNPDQQRYEEEEEEMSVRTPQEVAERILALFAVIGKVYQGDTPEFKAWYQKHRIERYLSDDERYLLNVETLSEDDRIDFSWRSEALVSLLWGIQVIDEMPVLNQHINVYSINGVSDILKDPERFQQTIQLRPDAELNEMEDMLYNQHWRVRDAQLFGKPMPSELDPSVVYERRYGLSWLVGWGDDWDEVPTDT